MSGTSEHRGRVAEARAAEAADEAPRRVLVVSHAGVVDVNQRLLVDLASAPGVQLALVAPQQWRSDLRGSLDFTQLPGLSCPVFRLTPFFSGRGTLHFYAGARSAVERFKPDIVHIDEEPWSVAALQFATHGARAGARILFHTKENIRKYYPFPFTAIERRVYALAACGVALTTESSRVLRAKGFSKPIFVIPHAVDIAQFTARDSRELRRSLGLKGVVVGYVGRLSVDKGVRDLLEALDHLAIEGIDVSALVVGSGPLDAEVKAANETGRLHGLVRWLPAAPHGEIQHYYNCIDILVVPSRTTRRWKEQFGRVVIEGLASGCTVVGSDSGEIPRLLETTGGGVSVPEGNSRALAEALASLLRDPLNRRALGDRGRAAVRERYACATIADQFLDVYRSLAPTGQLASPRVHALG